MTEDGLKLGRWYRARLGEYQNGLLDEDKAKQLETIGIQKESVLRRNWLRYYEAAKRFFEQNGHLNVGHNYVTDDGVKLGVWIGSQR